jgi:hypothetical protein
MLAWFCKLVGLKQGFADGGDRYVEMRQAEWSRFITRSKSMAAPYSTAPPAAIRSFTFMATVISWPG